MLEGRLEVSGPPARNEEPKYPAYPPKPYHLQSPARGLQHSICVETFKRDPPCVRFIFLFSMHRHFSPSKLWQHFKCRLVLSCNHKWSLEECNVATIKPRCGPTLPALGKSRQNRWSAARARGSVWREESLRREAAWEGRDTTKPHGHGKRSSQSPASSEALCGQSRGMERKRLRIRAGAALTWRVFPVVTSGSAAVRA